MDCKMLYVLLRVMLLTKLCPECYNIEIEIMLKLRLKNTSVCYIKAYRL